MKWPLLMVGLCLGGLLGCKKDPEFLSLQYEVVDKTRTYRNPRIPEELKNVILVPVAKTAGGDAGHGEKKDDSHGKKEESHGEGQDAHGGEKSESGHGSEDSGHGSGGEKGEGHAEDAGHGAEEAKGPKLLKSGEFDRIPLRVYLYEKTKGVLRDRNVQVDFMSGGGEIDLSDYVSQQRRGSFHIVFRPDYEGEGEFEVFYLSNAKERKVGDDRVGSGCQNFFKITKYFEKGMDRGGIVVNTTDQRHVSALAGTYFFLYRRPGGRVALSYVDILDSTHSTLMCR